MSKQEYAKYLNSPHWKSFRKDYFTRHEKKCAKCGRTSGRIELHHLSYQNLWNEQDSDMRALCFYCHAKLHPEQFKKLVFSY